MKQKIFALLLLISSFLYRAGAQELKPLIRYNLFFTDDISAEESRLIENLVQSYLSEMGELINYLIEEEPRGDTAYSEKRPPDFTLNGSIHLDPEGPIFRLEIVNTKSGEVYTVSSVYKSTGELALKARSILESAFAVSIAPEKRQATNPERISENQVIGSWKGEAGIEMIHLQRGGRGVAIFSSGAQMVLSYVIEGNTLRIWQISPNSERFYYPLPLVVAKRLAEGAEPMSWELSLYNQGTVLEGVKLATAVKMDRDRVVELLPGEDVRKVQWTKANP